MRPPRGQFVAHAPPLGRAQGRGAVVIRHEGKVPEGLMAREFRSQRIKELHGRLEQAIASESYEEAAGLRDEIRSLETLASP